MMAMKWSSFNLQDEGDGDDLVETVYFDQGMDEDESQFVVVSTLQDENFVVEALFCAIEEGNLTGLEELFSMSNIDSNQCNRHGETAVHIASGLGQLDIIKFLHKKNADIKALDSHGDSAIYWAARQGHDHVIRYLYEQGVSVDTQNKAKETALHVAARYGHTNAVQLLCRCCSDVNLPDEHGETALHIAVWHGFPKIVDTLCDFGAHTNLRNKEEETPLHCAAARGHTESVKSLLEAGVKTDLVDKNGCTALHLALRRHHVSVAMLLLQAGCQTEILDHYGEAPIHIVAREGLLSLAQSLCAFGCKVNVPNKMGLYPLHLAAKSGHIEVVRCLCLAGCNVEQKNREGITAEITALAQGFSEIGDLLNRLKNDQMREDHIAQLILSVQPISRVKLAVFGHSGVGKTTLLDSLKCGYFSSWFRRSKSSSSSSVSSNTGKPRNGTLSGKNSFEMNQYDDHSLSFETNYENYTHGIDVHQVTISGVGDLSLWEYSGHEPYYVVYDKFIGDTHCLHAIVFSLAESSDVQLQQVMFWLSFLQSRIPPQDPLGLCGRSSKPAKVVLIATHADVASCTKNASSGEFVSSEANAILQTVQQRFQYIFDLYDSVILMDAHVVGSPAMKSLKQYISNTRAKVIQGLPKHSGFLDSMICHLQNWRKSSTTFPVLSWQQFIDMVHNQVNSLSGMEHIKEVSQQLQLMGEILYLKSENQDMVVLNPRWLCTDIIGHFLSQEHLEFARTNGCYSVDDIQQLFPDTDALDLLQVLESLQLCTQCDNDGDIVYEFPCFNVMPETDNIWEKNDLRYSNGAYGGIRVQCWPIDKHLLRCIFPKLQVHFRKYAQEHPNSESSLLQWYKGSKFSCSTLESLITLGESGDSIEIKVRGPAYLRSESFYFMDSVIGVVDLVLSDACPGMLFEKFVLSPSHLHNHAIHPANYSPETLMSALLTKGTVATIQSCDNTKEEEPILDIILFGSSEILQKEVSQYNNNNQNNSINSPIINNNNSGLILGPSIHFSHLPLPVLQQLCSLLDPPEPIGRDWCMLGVLLGMTDMLPHLDPGNNPAFSPTSRILQEWAKETTSTVGSLLKKLEELGRNDAMDVILHTAPFLKVFSTEDEITSDEVGGVCSGSHTSSSNISR